MHILCRIKFVQACFGADVWKVMSRKFKRIKGVLPVRVLAVNGTRRELLQLAHSLDISHSGVCLGGMQTLVSPGEIVELEYKAKRARFRVVWSRPTQNPKENQLGLECLEPQKKIWGDLPQYTPEESAAAPASADGARLPRLHTRFPVLGGAEVRALQSETGVWTQLRNLGMGGCYCETKSPLPMLMRVRVLLRVEDAEIGVYGVVKSHQPYKGMGIQFTEFAGPAESQRLRALLDKLSVPQL